MPAKSLFKLATAAAIKNIRDIEDVGEAPYHVVRPVLLKVGNAKQLRLIEEKSPQICGADEEVWRSLIKRDVPREVLEQHNIEPKNPDNWWKVYRKLEKEGKIWRQEKDQQLMAVLNGKIEEKQANKMTYVEKVINPIKKSTAPRPTIFSRNPDSSHLLFGSGSRTNTKTGKGILLKAKREARENSLFSARRNVLSTPTHLLANKALPFPMQRTNNNVQSPRPVSAAPTSSRGTGHPPVPRANPGLSEAAPPPRPQPPKRPASSVLLPSKRRKV